MRPISSRRFRPVGSDKRASVKVRDVGLEYGERAADIPGDGRNDRGELVLLVSALHIPLREHPFLPLCTSRDQPERRPDLCWHAYGMGLGG